MSSLDEQMLANANEAMKLTRKFFVVELNYSEASIQQLEGLFDDVEFTMRGGKSSENVELLTRVWGSYLGEVLRRQFDGEWIKQADGAAAVQCGDTIHDTHEQVRRRLTKGAEHNVWQYYQSVAGG